MNLLLWVLQAIGALVYGASGFTKAFLFERISKDVPSFGALPRSVWATFGILEIVCAAGLIVPTALQRQVQLTALAAAFLAAESLLFIWVHLKYRETTPVVLSGVLGLVMAFIAYGRIHGA